MLIVITLIEPLQTVGQDSPDPMVDATREMVAHSGSAVIQRTRVPTGWIVGTRPMMVADPRHQWLNVEEETTFGNYVSADRAIYDELIPDLESYIKYVATDPMNFRVRRTPITRNARIRAVEDSVR